MIGGPTERGERTVRPHGQCLAARQSLKQSGVSALPIARRDRRVLITRHVSLDDSLDRRLALCGAGFGYEQ